MNEFKVVKCIVDNKCKETDKVFSYAIPINMYIDIGHRVIVPFGRGNKKIAGYVIGFSNRIDFDKSKLKSIIKLAELNPLIPYKIIELVKWMRDKYLCYYIEAIHAVLPANVRIKTTYYYELITNGNNNVLLEQGNIELLTDIIELLTQMWCCIKRRIKDNFNDNFLENALRKLIKYKLLRRRQTEKNRK